MDPAAEFFYGQLSCNLCWKPLQVPPSPELTRGARRVILHHTVRAPALATSPAPNPGAETHAGHASVDGLG